jgi:hypothetical protein
VTHENNQHLLTSLFIKESKSYRYIANKSVYYLHSFVVNFVINVCNETPNALTDRMNETLNFAQKFIFPIVSITDSFVRLDQKQFISDDASGHLKN